MPTDHLLLWAPMHHTSPFSLAMQALAVGGTATLMDRFDPERVLAEVERRGITWLHAVPTMMRRIMALPGETRHYPMPKRSRARGANRTADRLE